MGRENEKNIKTFSNYFKWWNNWAFKTIEVEEDIYGVSYGSSGEEKRGENLLIAVKDGKQFKVMEYDIQSRDNA